MHWTTLYTADRFFLEDNIRYPMSLIARWWFVLKRSATRQHRDLSMSEVSALRLHPRPDSAPTYYVPRTSTSTRTLPRPPFAAWREATTILSTLYVPLIRVPTLYAPHLLAPVSTTMCGFPENLRQKRERERERERQKNLSTGARERSTCCTGMVAILYSTLSLSKETSLRV